MNLSDKLATYFKWMDWLASNTAFIPREQLNKAICDAFAMNCDVLNHLRAVLSNSAQVPVETPRPGTQAMSANGGKAVPQYDPPVTPWIRYCQELPQPHIGVAFGPPKPIATPVRFTHVTPQIPATLRRPDGPIPLTHDRPMSPERGTPFEHPLTSGQTHNPLSDF